MHTHPGVCISFFPPAPAMEPARPTDELRPMFGLVCGNSRQRLATAAGNIPGVKVAHVGCLNVVDILNCDKFIISQDAVKKVESIYSMQEEAE